MEISVNGRDAIHECVRPRKLWFKRAWFESHVMRGEGYHILENPECYAEWLRQSRARIDLFTFMQRLPETTPKYAYPMEWDNFAALQISTFDKWRMEQIGLKHVRRPSRRRRRVS